MFVSIKCRAMLLDSAFLFIPVVVDMQYDYLIAGCCYSKDGTRLVVRRRR